MSSGLIVWMKAGISQKRRAPVPEIQFHDPNGIHHSHHHGQRQQQQLRSVLSAALVKEYSAKAAAAAVASSSSSSAFTSTVIIAAVAKPSGAENDESSRLVATESLHRAILHSFNFILASHFASLLSQGLSQLLFDESYAVRQSTAIAYRALCAVVCLIPIMSHGRQNHVMLGAMVDRFINWALSLLSNAGARDGTAELSLDSLREFINIGDDNGIERYALPILKTCQQLLEDEKTSLVYYIGYIVSSQ